MIRQRSSFMRTPINQRTNVKQRPFYVGNPTYDQAIKNDFPFMNVETPYAQFAKPIQPTSWPQTVDHPFNSNPYENHLWESSQDNIPFNPSSFHSTINQGSQPYPSGMPSGYSPYPTHHDAPDIDPLGSMNSPQANHPMQGILSQFQDENGQMDVNKMMSTVGQFAQTIQQVTPVVKQVSDLIKTFRTTS